MSKFLMTLMVIVCVAVVGVPVGKQLLNNGVTKEYVQTNYVPETIPEPEQALEVPLTLKAFNVKKVITLEAKNTVVFRGPVTSDSVAKVMVKLRKASKKIAKNGTIYLVLDTPGGSVFDGMDFIDFTKALPQKIKTITLFAASMGFQIVQNLDDRYITTSGTLMSHRARGGLRGQFDGELEQRYKMVKRAIDYLDFKASSRMSMDVKDYKKMIKDEYWVHGFDAVQDKAADERVLVRCGDSLEGTENLKFQSFFGTVNLEFSKCPLIKAPISVDMQYPEEASQSQRNYLNHLYKISFHDKKAFIREMLEKDNLGKAFKVK